MLSASALTLVIAFGVAGNPINDCSPDKNLVCYYHWFWWWPAPDGWVAIFTLLLFVSTSLLWWTTRKTLQHTEEASEHALRAYLNVRSRCLYFRDTPFNIYAEVIIKNFGQTPASHLRADVDIWIDKYPRAEEIPTLDIESDHQVISLAPGDEIGLLMEPGSLISQRDYDAVLNGSYAVWVSVAFSYEDIFRRMWRSDFRFFMTSDDITGADRRMKFADEGNIPERCVTG